jgi:TonB family protein
MKKIFVLCAVLIISIASVYCQSESKRYYDRDHTPSSIYNSSYYRVGKQIAVKTASGSTDSVFTDSTKTYYTNSGKLRSKEFRNKNGDLHNTYIAYFENGKIKERGTYDNGKRLRHFYGMYADGKSHYVVFYSPVISSFDENRSIFAYWDSLGNQLVKDGAGTCKCYFPTEWFFDLNREDGQVASGLRVGEWKLYRDNKLMNKEIYEAGRFVSGIAYTSTGEVPYTEFVEQSRFTGGLPALGKFVGKTMRYPAKARNRKVEGQSLVSFMIGKDGSVSDVEIVRTLDPDLDEEAMRVVWASNGMWTPGRQRGHPVRSRFIFPIRFNLH